MDSLLFCRVRKINTNNKYCIRKKKKKTSKIKEYIRCQ